MTLSELQRLARDAGFKFYKNSKGIHQIWKNPATGRTILLSPSKSRRKQAAFRSTLKRATA
jgi:predicted RNA binding protein YcfA (HicA-like mRNA interferase family)